MNSVIIYQSDFGPVQLGPKASEFRLRKNGDFDMRYREPRAFIRALKAEAQRIYLSSPTETLTHFNG